MYVIKLYPQITIQYLSLLPLTIIINQDLMSNVVTRERDIKYK